MLLNYFQLALRRLRSILPSKSQDNGTLSSDFNSIMLIGIREGFIFSTVFCGLFVFLLSPIVEAHTLAIWALSHCTILIIRLFFTPSNTDLNDSERQRASLKIAALGVLCTGASWGTAALIFINSETSENTFSIILFLSTVGFIGTINYWSLQRIGLGFLLLTIVPIYAKLAIIGNSTSYWQLLWLSTYLCILFLATAKAVSKAKKLTEKENENLRIKAALSRNWHLLEENKKALEKERELKQENEFYKDLINKAQGLIVMVHDLDQHGKIIYASSGAAAHFRMSKRELLGKSPIDIDPSLAPDYERILQSLLNGKALKIETQHKIAGKNMPMEVAVYPYLYKGKHLAINFLQDVTTRKELERKTLEYEATLAEKKANEQFKSMVETLPDHAIRVDAQMRLIYANTKVTESIDLVFKVSPTEKEIDFANTPLNKTHLEMTDFGKYYFKSVQESITTQTANTFQHWVNRGERRFCFDVRINPELNSEGVCIGALALTRDVTERALLDETLKFISNSARKQNEKRLIDSIPLFLCKTLLVDSAMVEIVNESGKLVVVSGSGTIEHVHTKPRNLEGTICARLTKKSGIKLFHSRKKLFPTDSYIQALNSEHTLSISLTGQKDKAIGYLTLFNRKEFQNILTVKTILQFFSGRMSAEIESAKLESIERVREREFQSLIDQSPDYISRFSAQGVCTYANPALVSVFPHFPLEGSHISKVAELGNSGRHIYKEVQRALESGEGDSFHFRLETKHKRALHLDTRIIPEFDNNGHITGVLTISRDITKRVLLEEDLRRQATVDQLTNLPNRRLFTQRLSEELKLAQRENHSVALLFIDLDRFKEINDTLGHEVGDDLLIETSARLIEQTSDAETIFRLGGDEFVVLVPQAQADSVQALAVSLLEALSQPYILDENESYISASIGIAQYPKDADSPPTLMSCADQAMYAAKQQGRNGYCFFTSSMQQQADARMSLINDLRSAVDLKQLEVVYQPIIDAHTQTPVKAEALLRWNHPEKGPIPPSEFIPLAEETGLIVTIGNWVFIEVIQAIKRVQKATGEEDFQIAINISPRHFIQSGAVDFWLSLIQSAGIPPRCITIEITESLLLDDAINTRNELKKLQNAGIQLALDDFGTGYSAMAYLKKFNIDYLKIDGSFIRDLEHNPSDRAITETISWMARRLGMKSIAECVESAAQKTLLEKFGCDYLQGYFFSKPLAISELNEFILKAKKSANNEFET